MGEPIPDLHKPLDEAWWIKEKLRREQFSHTPPTLGLRKEVADALEAVDRARSEADVRAILAAINERIIKVNKTGGNGPPTAFVPFDVEHAVERWRARFSAGDPG